jgi:hypothetical protein
MFTETLSLTLLVKEEYMSFHAWFGNGFRSGGRGFAAEYVLWRKGREESVPTVNDLVPR